MRQLLVIVVLAMLTLMAGIATVDFANQGEAWRTLILAIVTFLAGHATVIAAQAQEM